MFKSFFNKNKSAESNTKPIDGLVKEKPVLLYSIATSYNYLDALCSIAEGLEYKRIGPLTVDGFPEVIDYYKFNLKGEPFCDIFIYAYHSDNLFVIPAPFKELNNAIDESIFILNHSGQYRYLRTIADMVLTKNGIVQYTGEVWSTEKNNILNKLINDLGYGDELGKLILDEYEELKNNYNEIQKIGFTELFTANFHNEKIVRYTPEFIQERNNKMSSAYHSLIVTINRIQAWLDNDLLRKRIEFTTSEEHKNILGVSELKKVITPFCIISLRCDVFGRYNLAYGIDSHILNMLTSNMASTLIRRIYEFTPGELEVFVAFDSLSMDCITYFENFLKYIEGENFKLIEVERNEEKSISDMFNNLKLNEDIDEETKKWLKR